MLLGRCCRCKTVEPVTIKGLTASTGVTEWEYGPGALWVQHYGADEISGFVSEWTVNDRYVAIGGIGYWLTLGLYRSGGALTANCSECWKIVKIDGTDGTEIESATWQGVFGYDATGYGEIRIVNLNRIGLGAGLSGGDHCRSHSILPAVEWVDYTTNTANKEYILHAHTQQGGNVYLRTKTSSETITIPFNATAAQVKTLFENTADCTAATVTGGPWPGTALEVNVTWSAATGDISAIKYDSTYSAGGSGSCTFQWNAGTSMWVLVSDSCNPGPAEEPLTSGTYDGELRAGTCPVSFPPPPTGTRSTLAAAVSYDTGTGAVTNSVGQVFGLGASGTAATKLISETAGTVPTVTTLSNSDIEPDIYAGASNSLLVFGYQGTNGRTVEGWTVGTTWSRIWRRYINADAAGGRFAWAAGLAQSGTIAVCVRRRVYNTAEKSGVLANIAAGTFTEFDESEISTTATYDNNAAISLLKDGSGSDRLTYVYERRFNPATRPSALIAYNLGGSQYKTPTKKLLLGTAIWYPPFGFDTDRIYSSVTSFANGSSPVLWSGDQNTEPPTTTGSATAGSISRTYRWRFYAQPHERYNAGDWRIVFKGLSGSGLATQTTSWLDWQCSSSDIVNAVLAIFPENTEGVVSNVRVNPFGSTNVTDNSPAIGLIEANLDLFFQAASTLGFIDSRYVRPGCVSIEVRSLSTYPSTGGVAAYSVTDGSVSWSRNYGSTTSPAKTYATPTGGWLRGSRLILFGPVVDPD
jgi:hypothetical protein